MRGGKTPSVSPARCDSRGIGLALARADLYEVWTRERGRVRLLPALRRRADRRAREPRKIVTVTVLFCDVTGSTLLGESTDPEALRALLARYFERMKGIVESHGGTVEKFIGDAVRPTCSTSSC